MLSNLHNAWLPNSAVAHQNPHINVFVVYLLIQELFINKIHFFKFLSTSDKPWLDQLKIITVLLLVEKFSSIGTRKGKHSMLRTNTQSQKLIKHTKTSYSIASLILHKFLCGAYQSGLNQGISKLRHSKCLKKYEPC